MIRVATSPTSLSGPLAMLSAKDRKMRIEVNAMRDAIVDLLSSWATLENSLAFLLSMMTAQKGTPGWQMGLAIYFAPNNLETRIKIVDVALREWFRGANGEKKALSTWATISNAINRLKHTRNAVAHGATHIHGKGGKKGSKMYVRLSAPMTDINRLLKRDIPGLSVTDLLQSMAQTDVQSNRINEDLRYAIISTWPDSWSDKVVEQATDQTTAPPLSAAPNQSKRRAPRRSSRGSSPS
jgi:hypothetical protein